MSEIEPIRKSVTVKKTPDEAFRLFTDGIATWWPMRTHSVAEANVATVVFEARRGGRILERAKDGAEHVWGTVLAWDPPSSFVMSWHPGRAADGTETEVEVRFRAVSGGTRVELEHREWERLAGKARAARSEYRGGWEGVLGESYAAAAGAMPSRPKTFFVAFHRPGKEWRAGVSFREQPDVGLHVEHMRGLDARGFMVLGGPFLDDSGGMAILAAASIEEAREMVCHDPSIARGLLTVDVVPWMSPMGSAA